MNIVRDLVLCRWCKRTIAFAEIVRSSLPLELPTKPPEGVWCEETADGFKVGATTRSWAKLCLLPFLTVWMGWLLYLRFEGELVPLKFNLWTSFLGLLCLVWSILLPVHLVMFLAGHVVVCISGDEGEVVTGFGSVGFRRRFVWSEVETVAEKTYFSNGTEYDAIQLTGRSTLRFGTLLSKPRRHYLVGVLRHAMQSRGKPPKLHSANLFEF